MTMTRNSAETIARRTLQERFAGSHIEPAILDEHTQEHDVGWVFFYQSRQFLDTQDTSSRLAGNPPLVVDRQGAVHWLPTSVPPALALAALRETGQVNRS